MKAMVSIPFHQVANFHKCQIRTDTVICRNALHILRVMIDYSGGISLGIMLVRLHCSERSVKQNFAKT